ncbi:MAG: hypothetical protein HY040_15175 [Planctomycetes bacterium]|nr:hypothetical protein [Planctomycetota bacterium]
MANVGKHSIHVTHTHDVVKRIAAGVKDGSQPHAVWQFGGELVTITYE